MNVVVLPGDGIGAHVTMAAVRALQAVAAKRELSLQLEEIPCGGRHWSATGEEWPQGSFERCRDWADAMLLGAVGWPGAMLPDGDPAGKSVLFGLRFGLDLYANVRPVRMMPGLTHRLGSRRDAVWDVEQVDLVIVRENTEGLYAPLRGTLQRGGVTELAVDSRVVTDRGCRRVIEFAFRLAEERAEHRRRPPRVTCVDKSNVLDGCRLFRRVFHEVAEGHPGVECQERFIDAFCLQVITDPADYDVVVTTNMFGDIASDVAAVLSGGLGMAPSGQIGDSHGLFEPVHGSSPPLVNSEGANPLAAVLSAAMMLKWYGGRQGDSGERWILGGRELEAAVEYVVARGEFLSADLGGSALWHQVSDAVCRAVNEGLVEVSR